MTLRCGFDGKTNTEILQENIYLLNLLGPTKDRSSGANHLNLKFKVRAYINSETGPAGMQLKWETEPFTLIVLTTEHAVCRIISILCLILL